MWTGQVTSISPNNTGWQLFIAAFARGHHSSLCLFAQVCVEPLSTATIPKKTTSVGATIMLSFSSFLILWAIKFPPVVSSVFPQPKNVTWLWQTFTYRAQKHNPLQYCQHVHTDRIFPQCFLLFIYFFAVEKNKWGDILCLSKLYPKYVSILNKSKCHWWPNTPCNPITSKHNSIAEFD